MYNSYFGFLESPFSVTPDPRFFYTNRVYQEAYANLRYGIDAKKGFIVITGEVGTGKTTLLRKLMRNLEGTIHSVFIFNTHLNFNELLRLILRDLGLTTEGKDRLMMVEELNGYLIEQLKKGHIVCVLIDEAQNLSDEALEGLRLLSNLETDKEKLLQIVLMGQPELKAKLDQPSLRQLKQRVALQCRLAPLKDEEVGPYVDFRLQAVGYEGAQLFHPDTVQHIAFYSKGIPRLINIICDNALLNVYAASQKMVSADMIREVGRDLRLGPEVQVTQTERSPSASVSKPEAESLAREVPNPAFQQRARRVLRVASGMLLVILAAASVVGPQDFFGIADKGLQLFKRNLNQWVVFLIHQEAVSKELKAKVETIETTEAEPKWKGQPTKIPYGSTIYKIASDVYGANAALGMNLIKEFNPQIENLHWVVAGQDILLPPLTRETLLRKQPDGSYRLIVASFPSLKGADEYARRLGNEGHHVMITSQWVSHNLLLHRVEIDRLKNLEEANQTWEAGVRNGWFMFASNPRHGEQLSRTNITR
jgi:general secretion pathway protein A